MNAYIEKASSMAHSRLQQIPLRAHHLRRVLPATLAALSLVLFLLYYADNHPTAAGVSAVRALWRGRSGGGGGSSSGSSSSSGADRRPEWSSIDTIFAFGDTLTTTSFRADLKSAQPSRNHPFGNPLSAVQLSATSPWVHFLGTAHNRDARLRIYNHAVSNSVISPLLIPPHTTIFPAQSLFAQLFEFNDRYARENSSLAVDWSPESTLFATFFGVYDVALAARAESHPPFADMLASYTNAWESLAGLGARNVLVLDVPPIALADPASDVYGPLTNLTWDFNTRLRAALESFAARHPAVTTYLVSTQALFGDVLSSPSTFPATAPINQTDGPCASVAEALRWRPLLDPNFRGEGCEFDVGAYFWASDMLPTYRVQEVLADVVAQGCFRGEVRRGIEAGYCTVTLGREGR